MKENKILVTLLQLNFQFVPTRRRKKEEPIALKTKNEIQLDVLLIVLRLTCYFRKMTFIQIFGTKFQLWCRDMFRPPNTYILVFIYI